jgi:hypothetical protein
VNISSGISGPGSRILGCQEPGGLKKLSFQEQGLGYFGGGIKGKVFDTSAFCFLEIAIPFKTTYFSYQGDGIKRTVPLL